MIQLLRRCGKGFTFRSLLEIQLVLVPSTYYVLLLAKDKPMRTMTDPDSFAYLELYLSVSLILKSFHLDLPYTESDSISREASLPERLEWVAAVPIMPLEVCFRARQREG